MYYTKALYTINIPNNTGQEPDEHITADYCEAIAVAAKPESDANAVVVIQSSSGKAADVVAEESTPEGVFLNKLKAAKDGILVMSRDDKSLLLRLSQIDSGQDLMSLSWSNSRRDFIAALIEQYPQASMVLSESRMAPRKIQAFRLTPNLYAFLYQLVTGVEDMSLDSIRPGERTVPNPATERNVKDLPPVRELDFYDALGKGNVEQAGHAADALLKADSRERAFEFRPELNNIQRALDGLIATNSVLVITVYDFIMEYFGGNVRPTFTHDQLQGLLDYHLAHPTFWVYLPPNRTTKYILDIIDFAQKFGYGLAVKKAEIENGIAFALTMFNREQLVKRQMGFARMAGFDVDLSQVVQAAFDLSIEECEYVFKIFEAADAYRVNLHVRTTEEQTQKAIDNAIMQADFDSVRRLITLGTEAGLNLSIQRDLLREAYEKFEAILTPGAARLAWRVFEFAQEIGLTLYDRPDASAA